MKNFLVLILLPLLMGSCKNSSESEKNEWQNSFKKSENIDKLHWLLGTWVNEADGNYSQETWSQENNTTFSGYGFVEVNGELVFAETMALEQKGKDLLLTIAKVKPKAEKLVSFTLVSSENETFIFENKKHDFPQRIIYTKPAKDSLHVWIEGMEEGEFKKVDFYFAREKEL